MVEWILQKIKGTLQFPLKFKFIILLLYLKPASMTEIPALLFSPM